MAQVVATKLLHNSFLGNVSSLNNQIEKKIKPCGIVSGDRISSTHRRVFSVAARRAAAEVVPVTPQDVPKVVVLFLLFCFVWI